MKLLQVNVSKQQLEEIQKNKELTFEVDYYQMGRIFKFKGNDEPLVDPDYDDLYQMEKYDGIVLLQCRSKYPYHVVRAYPESTGRIYEENEFVHEQRVIYTLGAPIFPEELGIAEMVKL